MTQLLLQQISAIVEAYGSIGLFIVVTLESLGLPFPGETAIILASVAAAAGKIKIWQVALAAFTGAVLGDNIGYLIGRNFGKPFIEKHGHRVGITPERYLKAENIAQRYGPWMVLVARFFVLLRQLNGLVAGTTAMHWIKFTTANAVGAALWVGLWTILAYKLGHEVSLLPFLWHHITAVAAVLMGLVIVGLLIWYFVFERETLENKNVD